MNKKKPSILQILTSTLLTLALSTFIVSCTKNDIDNDGITNDIDINEGGDGLI